MNNQIKNKEEVKMNSQTKNKEEVKKVKKKAKLNKMF